MTDKDKNMNKDKEKDTGYVDTTKVEPYKSGSVPVPDKTKKK